MADNTVLNPGDGGDIIATDEVAGVKHQLVKLEYGEDGEATRVTDDNPLPVQIHGSIVIGTDITADQGDGDPNAIPWEVTGTVTASVPATSVAVISSVNSSATSVTILSINALRRQAIVVNQSTQILYLAFAATASASAFTYLVPAGGTVELPQPIYTGLITGLWVSANGAARITELTI